MSTNERSLIYILHDFLPIQPPPFTLNHLDRPRVQATLTSDCLNGKMAVAL